MQFMTHVVTEIQFVDGDNVSDGIKENYAKHLAEELRRQRSISPSEQLKAPESKLSKLPRSSHRCDRCL